MDIFGVFRLLLSLQIFPKSTPPPVPVEYKKVSCSLIHCKENKQFVYGLGGEGGGVRTQYSLVNFL